MSILINGNDLGRSFNLVQAIAPASHTATATSSEYAITNGTHWTIIVDVGVVATADASNYFTLGVTQSTTSGGTFSAVEAYQLAAINSWDKVINATTEGSAIYKANFFAKPQYDYIKIAMTETGTASAIFGVALMEMDSVKPTAST